MRISDKIRKDLIGDLLLEGEQKNNRLNVILNKTGAIYSEIITEEEINIATNKYKTHNDKLDFLQDFVTERLPDIISEYGFRVDYNKINYTSTDFYDDKTLNVPLIYESSSEGGIGELFNEIDNELEDDAKQGETAPNEWTPEYRETHKRSRPKNQNPRRVDLILNHVFKVKFSDYELSSDVGKWGVVKFASQNGKLFVVWGNKDHPEVTIENTFFVLDTNKIKIVVKSKNKVLARHSFEIYQIPTDEIIAERFFRKTVFNLLKKYIDAVIIRLMPFATEFIFWKTDYSGFLYSFSTPNKNKIVLDLIRFITTAQKPILDDFFEQNNLKHKQGYLQTLLDSAEAAGIFKFKRVGNEVMVLRGPNYRAFLEGKVRRVMS